MSAILDTCVDGEVGFAARDGLDVHPGVDKYVHDVFHVLLLSLNPWDDLIDVA